MSTICPLLQMPWISGVRWRAISQNSPCTIPSPARDLPHAKLINEVKRTARGHLHFRGDHRRRHDRPRQD
jgi:hypothetical protein